MFNTIYLDNNATTKPDPNVVNAMMPYLNDYYGNASSIYSFGKSVNESIEKARENVAKMLGAKKSEIIFTSCASESNQTAIMNAVRNSNGKKHIITTKVEHASIMETMHYLESIGYKITYLSVDNQGRISLEELKNSINDDTFLITIMMANNELGNIYPIKEIGLIANEHNILFHCDAVQAAGKIKIDVNQLNVDTLSISGHKIYVPKGIGVLYVKDGIPYTPLIFGHQENNRRGGTENVPYIIGMGKAAEMIIEDNYEEANRLKALRDKFEEEVKNTIEDVYIYGDLENRIDNTSCIAFKGVNAEELLLLLESFGVLISTGSACNSKEAEPSYVLTSCNADLENYSPIRVSLGKYNTEEEINEVIKRLNNIVSMVRRRNKN